MNWWVYAFVRVVGTHVFWFRSYVIPDTGVCALGWDDCKLLLIFVFGQWFCWFCAFSLTTGRVRCGWLLLMLLLMLKIWLGLSFLVALIDVVHIPWWWVWWMVLVSRCSGMVVRCGFWLCVFWVAIDDHYFWIFMAYGVACNCFTVLLIYCCGLVIIVVTIVCVFIYYFGYCWGTMVGLFILLVWVCLWACVCFVVFC